MEIKAGKNSFVLDFEGKTNEEELTFLEVTKHVVDKKLASCKPSAPVAQTPVAEIVKTISKDIAPEKPVKVECPQQIIVKEEVKPVISEETSNYKPKDALDRMMDAAFSTPTPAQKPVFKSTKEFLEAQPRKLVVGVCECEKQYHLWVDDPNQKELRFKCRRCEEEKVIQVEDLIPANYSCKECGKKASFWTEAAQSLSVDCQRCNAAIDMFYHDKNKMMTDKF